MPNNLVLSLDWFAAFSDILAGTCLAIPALRLSKHLLQLKIIQEPRSKRAKLERLRNKYVGAMKQLLAKWDAWDHRLLWIGFSAFVLGAIAKLLGLWLSSG